MVPLLPPDAHIPRRTDRALACAPLDSARRAEGPRSQQHYGQAARTVGRRPAAAVPGGGAAYPPCASAPEGLAASTERCTAPTFLKYHGRQARISIGASSPGIRVNATPAGSCESRCGLILPPKTASSIFGFSSTHENTIESPISRAKL